MADTPLTDDYVAEILKRDAHRNGQNRLVASGLGSLLGRPARSNAPKPNTRFLRNIVRDADTHNAALRKREEEESRTRLRHLRREVHATRRQDGEGSHERSSHGHRHRREALSDRERTLKKPRHRSRSRERHRKSTRSCSPRRDSDRVEQRSDRRRDKASESQYEKDDSDSDPLESVIGPKPPPKFQSRGRGAHKDSSMDARFDPSYDPKVDVDLSHDEDSDDWDMALEALRDRAKWRKSGAERLRAAGFTEEEVSNWKNGGGGGRDDSEKDISSVKWSKKGEGREWDRGKVADGGRVDVKAEWGRLKDN